MAVEQSVWDGFLNSSSLDKEKIPVVHSVLKELRPVEFSEGKLILACENPGIKFFLEKKIPLIEQALSEYVKKHTAIELVISPSKKRAGEQAPLLQFQPSPEDVFSKSGLNNRYSFENFAISSSNQVANAASLAVSENLGKAYNPLFLYGGVGVGKTHLAQAVAKKILEKDMVKKIFFCPGDQFTNELIESIRLKSTPQFRKKYRNLSLLIVDDIQFIAGKNTVQEEFFHTFNAIVSSGGQVILTSDRPPSEIKNLEDRLRSRFSGGLIIDIQEPDFELRTAIILIKAREKNIDIGIEEAKIIAEQVTDTRALEGALLSIYAKILGKKDRIDLEAVEDFFQEKTSVKNEKRSPESILKVICSYYNVKQSHIKSSNRASNIALPRQVLMFFLRKELALKLEHIAYFLKRKDHTTIIHGVEKIQKLLIRDPLLKQDVDRITQLIQTST